MAERDEYLRRLQLAVEHIHKCQADYTAIVPVHETFQGHTIWQGDVEVFSLIGHPKAKWCYAWSRIENDGTKEKFFAVLDLPPVNSPQSAVKASIVSEAKEKL